MSIELTRYGHSCVRLGDGARSLVIDPGVFSDVTEALDGTDTILITHEHSDHVDVAKVRDALDANSRLRLFAPAAVTRSLDGLGDRVTAVEPGQQFEAGGFTVRTFGGQHAVIHPAIPVITNVGYLVDDTVYHPGDSFAVPPVRVPTLLLPVNAPWSKISEVIDFAISVRAPQMYPIHDAMVNETYAGIVQTHLANIAGPHGTEYSALRPGTTVTV